MSKNENTILTEWLKKVAEKSFGKDLGYENVNCWLSPDRPNADLVIECTKDGAKKVYRFIAVT